MEAEVIEEEVEFFAGYAFSYSGKELQCGVSTLKDLVGGPSAFPFP